MFAMTSNFGSRAMGRVYLAGPMATRTYGECVDWRDKMRELCETHIRFLSPLRGLEYFMETEELPLEVDGDIMNRGAAIIAKCRMDVRRADAVVAYFPDENQRTSIGSMVEIGWADMLQTPVIVIRSDKEMAHDHPFVEHLAGWTVDSIEEAAAVLNVLFDEV